VDHQWNAEWLDYTTRLRTVGPRYWHPPCQEQRGSGLTASPTVSDDSAPVYTNGLALLRTVDVAQINKPSTLSSISNPSASRRIVRPDGSGWWHNRMAAQHLPRDLVRRSRGL